MKIEINEAELDLLSNLLRELRNIGRVQTITEWIGDEADDEKEEERETASYTLEAKVGMAIKAQQAE